jgi:hypothetical protein
MESMNIGGYPLNESQKTHTTLPEQPIHESKGAEAGISSRSAEYLKAGVPLQYIPPEHLAEIAPLIGNLNLSRLVSRMKEGEQSTTIPQVMHEAQRQTSTLKQPVAEMFMGKDAVIMKMDADLFDAFSAHEEIVRALDYDIDAVVGFWRNIRSLSEYMNVILNT